MRSVILAKMTVARTYVHQHSRKMLFQRRRDASRANPYNIATNAYRAEHDHLKGSRAAPAGRGEVSVVACMNSQIRGKWIFEDGDLF